MYDAVTVTLFILAAVLLRRPLLTDPDAAPGVRGEEEETGFMTLIRAPVRVDSPPSARTKRIKR